MIKEHGKKAVMEKIMKGIVKCCMQLGIELNPMVTETLAEDIMDVYVLDAIEDVLEALKKGRQGKYGFGYNSRNTLNLIIIREWMTKHLEEKSLVREKLIENKKHEERDFDIYEAYAKMMEKESPEVQKDKKALKAILDSTAVINKHLKKRLK